MLNSFIIIVIYLISSISCSDIDRSGYIVYCPCMGRFGNQADHFLGALGFSHGLNRTLVLPAWVEYRYGESKSIQVPFNTYFKVNDLQQFHRVMTMEKFVESVAPTVWPPEKRIAFCYTARGEGNNCNAKEGNPFGPFWDTYNIEFIGSEFYGPLHYDVYHHNMKEEWNIKYPATKWPVLAFTGAPASFPVQIENRSLQKYLKWSEQIENEANNFIKNTLPKGAFVGIHLRNGVDWVRACKHIPTSPNLFAASQCLGYQNQKGKATTEMCLPSVETIIRQLKRVIKNYNNRADKNKSIKSIFVASDSNHMIPELTEGLKRMKVDVFKYNGNNPHVDLAILGKSNHFVGNCISSFSAFVKRERDVTGFPSSFWAYPHERNYNNDNAFHDEL